MGGHTGAIPLVKIALKEMKLVRPIMVLKIKPKGMDPVLKWTITAIIVGVVVASIWGVVAHVDSLSEHKPPVSTTTQATTSGNSGPVSGNETAGPSSPITNNTDSNKSVDQKQTTGRDGSQVGIDNSVHINTDAKSGHKK